MTLLEDLKKILPIGRYEAISSFESTQGIAEIEHSLDEAKNINGLLFTFYGTKNSSEHHSSVSYLLNGSVISNNTNNISRIGTWKIKDNSLILLTSGNDENNKIVYKKNIITKIGIKIMNTCYIISINKEGIETIISHFSTEVFEPYIREYDCFTYGNVKITKKCNKNYKIKFSKINDFIIYQDWSETEPELNDDRVVLTKKPSDWINETFGNQNLTIPFEPTIIFRLDVDNKYVCVLKKAKINKNNNIVFTVDTKSINLINPTSNTRLLTRLPEGEFINVNFDIAVKNIQTKPSEYENKQPIWGDNVYKLCPECFQDPNETVSDLHHLLSECLKKLNKNP